MLGLGLGLSRSGAGYGIAQYLGDTPTFAQSEYSLAFNAEGAETLGDYEANTLYFRDSNFNRVAATFSRSTTATRVNKQGLIESVAANVPRIDYTDGSAKLLMEPSRTNLVFPSETATTQTRTVAAVAHTLSFYGTGSVTLSGVATGTLTGTGANNRVTLTFTPTAGSLTLTVSGSVTKWQLEAGSYPTSYIPTAGSAVTRNAESVIQSGLSSYIPMDGVVYQDMTTDAAQVYGYFGLTASTPTIRYNITLFSGIWYAFYSNNGSYLGSVNTGVSYDTLRHKHALRHEAGNLAYALDGIVYSASGVTTWANTFDTLQSNVLVPAYTQTARFNSIMILQKLSNAELAALTS